MSTKLRHSLYQWMNFGQFWLLPPTCVVCRRPGQWQLDLCLTCQNDLPLSGQCCRGCALPLPPDAAEFLCGRCLQRARRITTTVAACRYESDVRELITGFKYHQQLAAGRMLTSLLMQAVRAKYRNDQLPDLLLPVPLHPSRLRERGFNQSLMVARDLANSLDIPCLPHGLQRTRATPPQQCLDAHERRRNLRGAFALAGSNELKQAKHIALVDDVVTTMSTANEIARVLKKELVPAPRIDLWCLARA